MVLVDIWRERTILPNAVEVNWRWRSIQVIIHANRIGSVKAYDASAVYRFCWSMLTAWQIAATAEHRS
ncbi:hypothetical protein NKI56_17245 [Mesorhizobium sp. M0622]|uniref:hypothetical protein n=1 Tax=unclassified Mesorhizobium TaxID=325217 RepID=UPI00333DC18D